ncbi:MAG: acyltransferase family protein [Chitinophagaceae bacterium]|nr:acyltransferase family protein [Chitinophagaceae bacterium]
MENKQAETNWMNQLRALATFAVVLLHVAAPVLSQYGVINNANWMVGNIYDSMVRFCVPVFLMLTGALLLPKKIELTDFLKRRFARILLPFIFWSCIYILIKLLAKWKSGEHPDIISLGKYIFIQFRDGASLHFWYVYMIIGIYLFIPVLCKWINNSSQKEVLYFIIIWLMLIMMNIPMLTKFKPAIDLTYFAGFIGYPVLGYYLTKYFNYKNAGKWALVLIIAGITVTITGTYWATKKMGVFEEYFFGYLSPNVLLAATGIFLFFRSSQFSNGKLNTATNFISKYSYGIYLSHVLVLALLGKSGINWSFIHPGIGIPLTSIIVFTISLAVTYLVNKIPYGNYVSG